MKPRRLSLRQGRARAGAAGCCRVGSRVLTRNASSACAKGRPTLTLAASAAATRSRCGSRCAAPASSGMLGAHISRISRGSCQAHTDICRCQQTSW